MSDDSHRRHVFSVPPGAPFLATFVTSLLAGKIVADFPDRDDSFALGSARIFVPTRRAARALEHELARQVGKPAILLPQIVPLGAMEESETAALFETDTPLFEEAGAVGELERRLTLAGLIRVWSQNIRHAIVSAVDGQVVTDTDESLLVTASPAQAFLMARDLGALIDELTIEGVDPGRLARLPPERFDKYWGITLTFLKIVFETWPVYLAGRNLADRAHRQAELVDLEIARLQSGAAPGPQIVLGSTGTNAATAKLISAIAALPQGAVVLPGLDKVLDAEAWAAIGGSDCDHRNGPAAGHPQAALFRLLAAMRLERADVIEIGVAEPDIGARIELVREALRPAETTGHWLAWRREHGPDAIGRALRGVTLVEAEDERSEALAIAVALRQALETPGKTAALVTPDRDLALRVRLDLQRWGIIVDDSGGDALAGEPAGILANLILECAFAQAGSAAVLALLDHADVRLGCDAAAFAGLRTHAAIAALRGMTWPIDRPGEGIANARALAADRHAHRARRELGDQHWAELEVSFTRLAQALQPLRQMSGEHDLSVWLDAHWQVAMALLKGDGNATQGGLDESYRALRQVFDSLLGANVQGFALSLESYTVLLSTMLRETIVRGPRRAHPRIKILGLLEARLLGADLMLLGGLDEAIWPPAARTDAFLNRPMRAELGLSSPERRIGQTAHDFVEAAGAAELVLTRSKKRGGAPAVASRFIQRIAALAGDEGWAKCRLRGDELLRFAHALDDPGHAARPVAPPQPRPVLALRPQSLSVTQIETWRRDPYAIYAQHILKLEPLDDVDAEDGAAEIGTYLHEALAIFHNRHPHGPLPAGADEEIAAIARETLAPLFADAGFRAFRWPRILSSLSSFIAWESERRMEALRIEVEQSGALDIFLADGSAFTLRCRADRFEIDHGNAITIFDYKSGIMPSSNLVNSGLSPQLTLEAAMVKRGAFRTAPAGTLVANAFYVPIGKEGEIGMKPATGKDRLIADVAEEHFSRLIKLANQFRDPQTPYLARPVPQYASKYATYDHLARVKEWASSGGGEDS